MTSDNNWFNDLLDRANRNSVIDKIITTPVPEESVMALAWAVAAANLAENGEVKVTSTKGMNRADFLVLLQKKDS